VAGVALLVPTPAMDTDCGLPGALSVICSVALKLAGDCRVNESVAGRRLVEQAYSGNCLFRKNCEWHLRDRQRAEGHRDVTNVALRLRDGLRARLFRQAVCGKDSPTRYLQIEGRGSLRNGVGDV